MSVVPLHAIEGGFDFDGLFESLKGHEYRQVLVIADDGEGYGNVTVGDALLLMERLRLNLAKDDDE